MPDFALPGCGLEPLGDYLKAIGVLRLLGMQVDPTIRGRWVGDEFVLTTGLSADDLVAFFMDNYVPTPIITPWNSGSGFGADDATKSKTAFEAVETIAATADPRLEGYRTSIAVARTIAALPGWDALDKQDQVTLCRNNVPDAMVDWIDAAVVLTSDSRSFPPLLGTGGNDGRLDFGSNVMQRLIDVLAQGPKPRASDIRERLLANALYGATDVQLDRAGSGQFDPFSSGGPASSPLGSMPSISNPWGFLLTFEGAIAFASGTARKLGASGATASVGAVPFTSSAVSAAYGSAAHEEGGGEFWAPVWARATTWRELERTIAEARVDYRGRRARSGSDFARAVATHGTERGIDQFVRFGFLERNGQSTFCVPLGRHRANPSVRAGVLGQTDDWVGRVRWASNPPESAQALVHAIDERLFGASAHDDPAELQALLLHVARLEQLASRSRGLREAARGPVYGLSAADWLPLLDDGTPEFQIAVSLASLRAPKERWGLIRHLVIDLDWRGRPAKVGGLGLRPLFEVLADCVVHLARRGSPGDDASSGWCGSATSIWAPPGAFAEFARGRIDESRLEQLLMALMLLDWRKADWRAEWAPGDWDGIPTAVQVLQPAFHHRGLGDRLPSGRRLLPGPEVPRLLTGGQVERALDSVLRSLRIAGCPSIVRDAAVIARGTDGRHLAAVCLVPVSDSTSLTLLNQVSSIEVQQESETTP
jgi:CRISPR-associated protein Csx17